MNWLKRWLRRVFRRNEQTSHDAIQRFMIPQADRLTALGVLDYEVFVLGVIAIQSADFIVRYPGAIFRDMADAIERGDTTAAEIIRCHSPFDHFVP